ncbi:MAG: amidohydrolase family protein [Alphaproteobacteria bacterium]
MTIDMHSHLRPAALIEPLRARKTPPMIVTGDDGKEYLKGRSGGMTPLAEAFDSIEERVAVMDRCGISTAALSLFGGFQWIEALPLDEGLPLIRLHNDSMADTCRKYPGRFIAYATLPLSDMNAAVAEFERVMAIDGFVGAIVPGNAFMTVSDTEAYRPLLAAANRHRAVVFIHWGPRPGDAWPRVRADADNWTPRLITLDMQAALSSNMLTLTHSRLLEEYPDAYFHVHNLGGNFAYELERLDHRNPLDTPDEPEPSSLVARSNLYVDCNSLGRMAIEIGAEVYGSHRIMFGTDGTEFGNNWSLKALAEARISDADRRAILHDNAARILAHLAPLAPYQAAAE